MLQLVARNDIEVEKPVRVWAFQRSNSIYLDSDVGLLLCLSPRGVCRLPGLKRGLSCFPVTSSGRIKDSSFMTGDQECED